MSRRRDVALSYDTFTSSGTEVTPDGYRSEQWRLLIDRMEDMLQRLDNTTLAVDQENTVITSLSADTDIASDDFSRGTLTGGIASISDDQSTATDDSCSTSTFMQRLRFPLYLIANGAQQYTTAVTQFAHSWPNSRVEDNSTSSGPSSGPYIPLEVEHLESSFLIEEIERGEEAGGPTIADASPVHYLQLAQDIPDSPSTDNRWQADDSLAFPDWAVVRQDLPQQLSVMEEASTDYDDSSTPSNLHNRRVLETLYSGESDDSAWRRTPHQPPIDISEGSVAHPGGRSGARQGTSLAPIEYFLLMRMQHDIDNNSMPSSSPSLTNGADSVQDDTGESLLSQIETASTIVDELGSDTTDWYSSEAQSAGSYPSLPQNNPAYDGDTVASTSSYQSEVAVAVSLVNSTPQVVGFEIVIPARELDDPPDRTLDAAASQYYSETE